MDNCAECNSADGTIAISNTLLCKECVILMYKSELVTFVSIYQKPVFMTEFDVNRVNGKLAFTYRKVMKVRI